MPLSAGMQQALENWIITRLKSKCPVCGGSQFGYNGVYGLGLLDDGAFVPGKFQPVIPLACLDCGNVVLISAIALGLTKDDTKQQPK